MMSKLDSDDVRIFLAVARSGSLSMAARLIGATQPTLGRRLARLERDFGLVLFQKSRTGYSLTLSGRKLLAAADGMMSAETAFLRQLEAERSGSEPVIRIWAGVWMSKIIVGKLPALQAAARCRLVLFTESRVDESQVRVNDIVVKHGRVKGDHFVARRLGRSPYAAFGSQHYVDGHPEAWSAARCGTGSWILVHNIEERNQELQAVPVLGYPLIGTDARVIQCTSAQTVYDVVRDGQALGFLPISAGKRAGLVQVSQEESELEHDYWLSYREEARLLPHVTAVARELGAQLAHSTL